MNRNDDRHTIYNVPLHPHTVSKGQVDIESHHGTHSSHSGQPILKKKNLRERTRIIGLDNDLDNMSSTLKKVSFGKNLQDSLNFSEKIPFPSEQNLKPARMANSQKFSSEGKLQTTVKFELNKTGIKYAKSQDEEKKKIEPIARIFEKMYNSNWFLMLFGVIIFLSLFIRDLWIITFNSRNTDPFCDIILYLFLTFFFVESIINSVTFQTYRFSLVFFVDSISSLTLFLDTSSLYSFKATENFRSGDFHKLIRLLTILKLWRATRFYFRKNQVSPFVPLNNERLDKMVEENLRMKRRNGEGIPQDQLIYFSQGSEDEEEAKESIKKSILRLEKYPNIRSSLRIKSENSRSDESEVNSNKGGSPKLDEANKAENYFQPKELKISQFEFLEENRFLKVNPVLSVSVGIGLDMTEKKFNIWESAAHISKVKDHEREARQYLALTPDNENTLRKSIVNHRLSQSGNISKILIYLNVRNMTCFLILSNLGLSFFLSSIFTNDPKLCELDHQVVQLVWEDSTTKDVRDKSMSELAKMFERKYSDKDTPILRFEVSDHLYSPKNSVERTRRREELIICTSIFESHRPTTTEELKMTVVLDNRKNIVLESMMNILRGIVLIVILLLSIYGSNNDIRLYAVKPITTLLKYVVFS